MAAKIPFVRDMDFEYEQAQQVSPLIRRLIANNPGPFTFKGTGVYIIGRGEVAIIDPGPDDPAHIDALLKAVEGETVTHILVTHRHMDHSPAAHPLAERTGAKVYASTLPPKPSDCDALRLEASDDHYFTPDINVEDGQRFSGPGWTIEAVFTPGHTTNHMAYALLEENALFPGDHIMGWSTTVIGPPDGDMTDYMASLQKLHDREDRVYYPAHGPQVDKTRQLVRGMIGHRRQRENQILRLLAETPHAIPLLVPRMYKGVDERLWPAAGRSVLAHLIDLERKGRVARAGETWTLAA